jgi:hypothetical protein
VAFTASLADGRRVVVRADPVGVVPEPSTVTLRTTGTLLLFVIRLI